MIVPRAERALVLAPLGRDAVACEMLAEAGFEAEAVPDIPALVAALADLAGFAVVTEEALRNAHTVPLADWLAAQPSWSDFPFILLTAHGGVERNPSAARKQDLLGNVTFVERPFHPTTLISAARSALRGRRRQYEARARLEALHESDERFRAAIVAVQSVLWTNSADGQMVGEQPGWSALTGQARAEYEGYGWAKAVHRDDAQPTIEAWHDALTHQKLFVFEHRVRRYDGAWRDFSIRAIPTFASDGSLREWVGVHTDITERKQAERALRELNETLENRVEAALAEQKILADIVETTESFVNVVGLDMRWLALNRAARADFERVFGVAPRVGDLVLDALAHLPEQREQARLVWERVFTGRSFTLSGEFGDPARARPVYELRYSPLRDGDGQIIGGFVIGEDITERKRQEADLAQAQDALRQAQKMEAIGQLTGGVAHDFNNMLTVIRSSADLLKRPGLAPERRDMFLDGIAETANRAAKLTQQLLAFSRQQALKPEAFDARARVQGIADMLRTLVGARVKLSIEASPSPLIVEADIAQFETAIVNLCVNARDAMDGEGALGIRLESDGDCARVTVSDTGTGIAPGDLARIFDPFFTTKEIGKGTGLGLSQVYGFAKQSGGDVQVESEVGKGTAISLILPRSVNGLAAETPDTATATLQQTGRILVVEDNDQVRAFACELIGALGFQCESVSSAVAALQRLAREPAIDLVFSDVMMQGMDGIALAREIAARLPGLPVLLTSGYSEALSEDSRHGFPFIAKPYDPETLAAAIAEARAGKRSPAQ